MGEHEPMIHPIRRSNAATHVRRAVSTLSLQSIAAFCLSLAWTPALADSGIEASTLASIEAPRSTHTTERAAANPVYSLLDNISAEFYLPVEMNSRTEAQLNWYVRNPAYLNRVFERSRRYLPHIVDEIRARGMPLELALLPVVRRIVAVRTGNRKNVQTQAGLVVRRPTRSRGLDAGGA